MAIISTYPIDASVNLTDKLIGTDLEDSSKTKNYTVGSILQLLSTNLPIYADNASAITGGLTVNQLYRNAGNGTTSSVVCVVY